MLSVCTLHLEEMWLPPVPYTSSHSHPWFKLLKCVCVLHFPHYLYTCFSIASLVYLGILEKGLAFCEHCQAGQNTTFVYVIRTELRQKSSNLTCIYSLSSERLYLCCWSYFLFLNISMCKAGLKSWIQGSQVYLYHYKSKRVWHLFICTLIHSFI